MAKTRHAPKLIACRFCGSTCDKRDRDQFSGWTHSHPAICPYREDSVPALNGVHVGDKWRNRHTGNVERVGALRLGGAGVYTDREPVVVWEGDEGHPMPHTLWSLAEHWEPVTRPGEWPVPWEERADERYPNATPLRWALDPWRCPEHRGHSDVIDWEPAYYHAWHHHDTPHTLRGWGEPWQIDHAALDVERLPEPQADEQLALLV